MTFATPPGGLPAVSFAAARCDAVWPLGRCAPRWAGDTVRVAVPRRPCSWPARRPRPVGQRLAACPIPRLICNGLAPLGRRPPRPAAGSLRQALSISTCHSAQRSRTYCRPRTRSRRPLARRLPIPSMRSARWKSCWHRATNRRRLPLPNWNRKPMRRFRASEPQPAQPRVPRPIEADRRAARNGLVRCTARRSAVAEWGRNAAAGHTGPAAAHDGAGGA